MTLAGKALPRVAALVAALCVLAACSGAPTAERPITPRPTPTEKATTGTGDRRDVEGARSVSEVIDEVTRIEWTPKASAGVVAMEEAGTLLIARSDVSKFEQGGVTPQAHLSLSIPGDLTGQDTSIPLGPSRSISAQLVGADLTSDWVVWMETPSTELNVQPWVMYAYDRSAGVTTEVTRSGPQDDEHPTLVAPGFTGPSLHGDTVVWAEADSSGAAPSVDIVGCHITDCVREVLMAGAAYPSVTSTEVFGVTAPGYRGKVGSKGARNFHDVTIRAHDFATGKTRTVLRPELQDTESSIMGLAAADEVLVWTTSPDSGVPRAVVVQGDTQVEITGEPEQMFGYPVATNSFVAWAESSGSSPANVGGYLYRLADRAVLSVGNSSGLYGIEAAGNQLSWQESEDERGPRAVMTVVGRFR